MRRILDKLLLLLLGLIFHLSYGGRLPTVLLFLGCFICLAFEELFQKPTFSYILLFTGAIAGLFFPEVVCYLPVLCYPLFEKRFSPLVCFALPPVIAAGFTLKSVTFPFLTGFLIGLSLLMADRERRLAKISSEFIRLRDTDREEKLSLQEKARTLIENQDAGIKIATLQERTRIAREIHDNVGHLLSRSLLQVGAMLTVKKEDESLLLLKESLDAAMQGIRNSVHDLRDDALDLEGSVKQLLSDYSSYRTIFEYDMAPEVPTAVTYCFLTITKEALSNIVKHSNGTSIHISMKEYTSLYGLSIGDNGTDSSIPGDTTGMGLDNMQARVAALKGTIRFSTQNGFHIFVSIPK